MNEDRRKEIALKVCEKLFIDRGIPGGDSLKRDIGNAAKDLGITTEEAMEFYRSFVPKVLGRLFGFTYVSLNMSNATSSVNPDNT